MFSEFSYSNANLNANNAVGEVGVQTHPRHERDRIVGIKPHDQSADRGRSTRGHEHGAEAHPSIRQNGRVHEGE